MGASVEHGLPASILPSLRDGTFPSSDTLLLTDVSQESIPSILDTVSDAKKQLSDEIGSIFREQGKDVGEWIVQAKKVQAEIANCKNVAREIVKEHEKARKMEAAVQDARAKVQLLQNEIAFSSSIQEEFEGIEAVNRDLDAVQTCLIGGDLGAAASRLHQLRTTFARGRASHAKELLNSRRERLAGEAHGKLEEAWDKIVTFGKADGTSWVKIVPVETSSSYNLDTLLEGFENVETLDKVTAKMAGGLEEFVIQPLLRSKSQTCSSATADRDQLSVELTSGPAEVQVVMDACATAVQFLHSALPELIKSRIIAHLLPGFVSKLIKDWLMPSVPFDLADITTLHSLQEQTRKLGDLLISFEWPCHQELFDWIEEAPLMWIARRKMASLHGVRKAFSTPRGPVRQVERIETEIVSEEEDEPAPLTESGALTTNNLDPRAEDDESTGWDFEADDDAAEQPNGGQAKDDDAEEAWAWDEEDNAAKPGQQESLGKRNESANGLDHETQAQRQMTLVETYTISDIPDYLLEIIGRDILDAQTVKDPDYTALESASPSEGLMAIPSSVLAMFRATAPTYYATNLRSGNMHLYNDSMYIVQKLREATVRTEAIEANCRVMEKFGRSAYAREMDTQRTILGDLLDGAQGFVRCTQPPNSNECEIAVTSCVDRIRSIHEEWSAVLSHSALLQSIGSLTSAIISKIIEDVEDIDDISEPESKRLTSFCNQITSLEELFMPQDQEDAMTTAVIYVPTWLKFQYLINILEASLVDIRYMWIEGELSLEFTDDEVVDLIKALFAESTHRKSAITAIKQHIAR